MIYLIIAIHSLKGIIKKFFEVGTEEQSGSTNTPEELEYTLNEIKKFCKRNKFEMPLFVVIQAEPRF